MQIGIDGLPLTLPKTGVGHYTFDLAQALAKAAPESELELVYPSTFPPVSFEQNQVEDGPRENLKLKRVVVGPLARPAC